MHSQKDAVIPCRRVPRIAVTGGIACGKSEFGRLLSSFGAEVADADEVVHILQAPGGALAVAVEESFGAEYLASDGSVDRRKLAKLVFAEPIMLEKLNSVSRPLVRDWFLAWSEKPTDSILKAALVPLLFESGWKDDWDLTVCVACSSQTQRTRLVGRGLNETEIQSRIDSQWDQMRKMKMSDIVVMNDGNVDALKAEAARVIKTVLEKDRKNEYR